MTTNEQILVFEHAIARADAGKYGTSQLMMRLRAYNFATNPTQPQTDAERKACDHLAATILAELQENFSGLYFRREDGRLAMKD